MAIKTLLVGLGGTGCEIVARVKRLINTNDPNVQFVGFDTDGGWDGVEGLQVIYTSREMSVRQYLADLDGWEDWFPDNALLKGRNMIKGAGQVRPLSRLAFAETCSSGRIGKLDNAIRELQIARGEVEPSNFRIMIVSSFAGGTGSGMYLQTALFLRQYIRKHYGGEVIVRGLFALPDLFRDTNPSPVQKESMYANAYAALKELNAINQVCLSDDPSADAINMQILPLFDSKKDRGNVQKKPFDFIFFVDDINSRGMVLKSLEDYKRLMTTATYMQVYSPITAAGDSREDNAILTVIDGDGKPLYGGVGASKIIYPYEDLVEYCGTRATVESISDLWTVVDEDFNKADAENKAQMKVDPTLKPLSRQDHFIATVENLLAEGANRFNFLQKAITDVTEDGTRIDRADDFYGIVHERILSIIQKDSEIVTKANNAGVTEKQLKKELAGRVTTNETALKNYLDTVNERIILLKSSIVQSILPDDLNSALSSENEWNIRRLVTQNGSIAHPLAVRLLLYKFRAALQLEMDDRSSKAKLGIKKINDYFKKAYDLPETKETIETAAERAGNAKGGKKRSFREDYFMKSTKQKKLITTYRDDKAIAVVFEELIKRLNSLIEQYERLFDSLEDITKELGKEILAMEEKRHNNSAEAAVYLCATAEEKRELYESLRFNCSDSNDNGVYNGIFDSLYKIANEAREAATKKTLHKKSEKAMKEERNATMGQLFRESVVARNIKDIAAEEADKLDLHVLTALEKDQSEDSVKDVIEKAFDKARPYLMTNLSRKILSLSEAGGADDESGSAYTLTFWGINPEVKDAILADGSLTDVKEFFRAGAEVGAPEVVSNDEYSRYEISCYQALYCVALSEIPKFAETGDSFGVFYEHYSRRIRSMIRKDKTALTPHLDIRWHKRSYLPMISADKNLEDDRQTARSFWLAMIYGGLPEETRKGKKVVYASFARTDSGKAMPEESYPTRDLKHEGKLVGINDVWGIFKAMQMDEVTTLQFEEVFGPALEADMDVEADTMNFTGPRARRFAKKLISEDNTDRNALNLIARFVGNSKATDGEKRIFVEALQKLMEEFLSELTEDRHAQLRSLIYKKSRFATSKTARASLERYINFEYWEGKE
ncbi:MAG: hypothetical protein IJF34_06575 [Clostridia bacterium]|nr:hypothetical protein [Clostridia bacterium]